MKVAIMQPYFIPYIGYYQLVQAADIFIFYDDVNFIKKGWINKNNILINGQKKNITIPCIKISQNKTIRETEINTETKEFRNVNKTIGMAYKKAPYYSDIFPILEKVMAYDSTSVAEIAARSIVLFMEYLGVEKDFKFSSVSHADSKGMDKADRLIQITKAEGATHYINAMGGVELYDKKYFKEKGVHLDFLEPHIDAYKQYGDDFISGLSFLDALMFNSKEELRIMLDNFKLV